MKQYNRGAESELTRFLINESYQESEEFKLEFERLNEDYFFSKERYNDLFSVFDYDMERVVNTIERVLEMQDNYRDYNFEDDDWGEEFDEGYVDCLSN
jgi:hypothetical protein